MELFDHLGLDVWVLLSQLINFAILYFLLKVFALDKIMAFLDDRQKEIAQGVNNAQKAEELFADAEEKKEAILAKARLQGKEIVAEARGQAKVSSEEIMAEAKGKATAIVAASEQQAKVNHDRMLADVKGELADVIALGVAAVVDKKVSSAEVQKDYLQAALKG